MVDRVAVVFVLSTGIGTRAGGSGGNGKRDVCATERVVDGGSVLGGIAGVETEGEEDGTGLGDAGRLDGLGGCDRCRDGGIGGRWQWRKSCISDHGIRIPLKLLHRAKLAGGSQHVRE